MPTRIIYGSTGPDMITIPDGRDPSLDYDNIVYGYGANDTITGGAGNDWIWGSSSDLGLSVADNFSGGAGDDVIISWANGSTLDGGAGNDILIYSGNGPSPTAGPTVMTGGDGNDQLWALNGGAYTMDGGAGDDLLVGGGGPMIGGAGNDTIIMTIDQNASGVRNLGGIGAFGGDGNDTIYALAGAGPATLYGGAGRDLIVGNGQGDSLYSGNDNVQDVLIGASGQDSFWIQGVGNSTSGISVPGLPDALPHALNSDLIWNFETFTDRLYLDNRPLLNSPNTAYHSTQGYNYDLMLSGTLITLDTGDPVTGAYTHTDVVFLAGVNTDIATLMSAGSLTFTNVPLT